MVDTFQLRVQCSLRATAVFRIFVAQGHLFTAVHDERRVRSPY